MTLALGTCCAEEGDDDIVVGIPWNERLYW
jgi:hypothetical protein